VVILYRWKICIKFNTFHVLIGPIFCVNLTQDEKEYIRK